MKMANKTYTVVTGDGGELTNGVSAAQIERIAQEFATEIGETVYYSESGGADLDEDDDEDIGVAVEPETECQVAAASDALRVAGYDTHARSDGTRYIADLAPDASEYGGDTAPGSAWDAACDEIRARIQAIVEPHGCTTLWDDDDLVIEAGG